MRPMLDGLEEQRKRVNFCDNLDWISTTDYTAQQNDIVKRRQEGTVQWFLKSKEVSSWFTEAKSTLFCPGIPGAGKTMLAAIAIEHLLELAKASCHGVAYLYCNYKRQREEDATSMLSTILRQLLRGPGSAEWSVSIAKELREKCEHRQARSFPTI